MKILHIFKFLLYTTFFSIQINFIKTQIGSTGDYTKLANTQIYLAKNNNVYIYATVTPSGSSFVITLYLYSNLTETSVKAAKGIWTGIGFGSGMSGSDMIICWTDSAGAAKCEDYVGTSSSANKIASQVTSLSAAGTKATALSADFSPYKTLFEWKFTVSTSSHVANFSAGTSALMTCYGFNFLGSSSSKHVNYYRISSSKDGDAAGNRPAVPVATPPSKPLDTAKYTTLANTQIYLAKNNNVYIYATVTPSGSSFVITLYLYSNLTETSVKAAKGIWTGIGFGSGMSGSDMIICWTDSAGAAKCEDYVGTSSSANKIASQVTSLSAAGTKATALSADFFAV